MRSFVVIRIDPLIQILLQIFDRVVYLLPESNCIEFILNGSMKSFTNTVGPKDVLLLF